MKKLALAFNRKKIHATKKLKKELFKGLSHKQPSEDSLKRIRKLIKDGADVNARYDSSDTFLMQIVLMGHADTAKIFLESGADVNLKRKDDNTALTIALICWRPEQLEIAKLLVEAGTDFNTPNNLGQTALSLAQDRGHSDLIQLMQGRNAAKEQQAKKDYEDFIRSQVILQNDIPAMKKIKIKPRNNKK